MAKTKASAKQIDFSGVRDRGNFNPRRVKEGDYSATVTKVEDAKTKEGGEFQYVFTIKLDAFSQNSYPYYCKLAENQLWKIRNLLIAAGINVPKRKLKVDPNRVVGKKVGVTMEDDEFEGKEKSVIGAVFPVSELEGGVQADEDFDEDGPEVAGDDDAEDEPKASKKTKKKKAEEPPAKAKKKGKKKKKGSDKEVEDIDINDV